MPRPCAAPGCSQFLRKSTAEKPQEFARRLYCDRDCYTAARREPKNFPEVPKRPLGVSAEEYASAQLQDCIWALYERIAEQHGFTALIQSATLVGMV